MQGFGLENMIIWALIFCYMYSEVNVVGLNGDNDVVVIEGMQQMGRICDVIFSLIGTLLF